MNISPEQHKENRRILEEIQERKGTSEDLDVLGSETSVDDVKNEKALILSLYSEIRPFLYGVDPTFATEGKVNKKDPVRDILQHHIETYKGDPFVVVELLTMLVEELKNLSAEELTPDVKRQEVYKVVAQQSLKTVEELFHDYFPDEYEARFVASE